MAAHTWTEHNHACATEPMGLLKVITSDLWAIQATELQLQVRLLRRSQEHMAAYTMNNRC